MGHKRGVVFARGADLKTSVAGVLRPSVEALLLAAVAMGCAQAGWTLLTPTSAGASGVATRRDNESLGLDRADIASPFAPEAGNAGAGSHAANAVISTMQLAGVRMSTDASRDGAVLSLSGGDQHAFLIGDEIAEGIVLADVEPAYVLLTYDGGQQRLQMASAPQFSFARAMMGLEPEAPAATEAGNAAASGALTAHLTEADRSWLIATIAHVEVDGANLVGWRVADGAPEAVRAVGLQSGDLIVAVNGEGPRNLAGALASLQSGRFVLEVERAESRFSVAFELGEPA